MARPGAADPQGIRLGRGTMRLSMTLSGYVARQVLLWLGVIFAGIASMVFLLDIVEQLRKAAGKPDVTIGVVVQLSLLQLPFLVQKTLPFMVLFGSMMAFWKLSRTNELVIARAAGVSAWQFLFPAVLLGALVADPGRGRLAWGGSCRADRGGCLAAPRARARSLDWIASMATAHEGTTVWRESAACDLGAFPGMALAGTYWIHTRRPTCCPRWKNVHSWPCCRATGRR